MQEGAGLRSKPTIDPTCKALTKEAVAGALAADNASKCRAGMDP